jgi:hypothetical protein
MSLAESNTHFLFEVAGNCEAVGHQPIPIEEILLGGWWHGSSLPVICHGVQCNQSSISGSAIPEPFKRGTCIGTNREGERPDDEEEKE